MNQTLTTVLIIILISILSCRDNSSTQAENSIPTIQQNETPYYPLARGYIWEYEEYVPGKSGSRVRYTEKILDTIRFNQETYWIIEIEGRWGRDSTYKRVENGKVFRLIPSDTREELIFDDNLSVGEGWEEQRSKELTYQYSIIGQDTTLKLGGDTYSNVTLLSEIRVNRETRKVFAEKVIYYAKDIGMVGWYSKSKPPNFVTTLERGCVLKSFEKP